MSEVDVVVAITLETCIELAAGTASVVGSGIGSSVVIASLGTAATVGRIILPVVGSSASVEGLHHNVSNTQILWVSGDIRKTRYSGYSGSRYHRAVNIESAHSATIF